MTSRSGDSTHRPARKMGCGLVPAATVIWADLLWGTLPSYNRTPASLAHERTLMAKPTNLRDALRVKPGTPIRVEKVDPAATFGHDKLSSVVATQVQMERLRDL